MHKAVSPHSVSHREIALHEREECGYSLDLQAGEHRLVDPGEKAEERVTAGAGGRAVPPPDSGTGAAGKPGPSSSFGGAIGLADAMITTERLDQKIKSTKI